jgi:hypothetical protein
VQPREPPDVRLIEERRAHAEDPREEPWLKNARAAAVSGCAATTTPAPTESNPNTRNAPTVAVGGGEGIVGTVGRGSFLFHERVADRCPGGETRDPVVDVARLLQRHVATATMRP